MESLEKRKGSEPGGRESLDERARAVVAGGGEVNESGVEMHAQS